MFGKLVTAIEPFAFTLVILAGATLAGWVDFSNKYAVGVAVVFFGIMLMLNHIVKSISNQSTDNPKKGKKRSSATVHSA